MAARKQYEQAPAPSGVKAITLHPHVAYGYDNGGTYVDAWCVAGTPIPVRRIYDLHKAGHDFEKLFRRYPTLTRAQVLSAVAFVYDNPGI